MLRSEYESKALVETRLAWRSSLGVLQNLKGHGEGLRNVCVKWRGSTTTCACCCMFEDEDDILVCCQEPDCSFRSANYELSGVLHGRCAAALGHSGGARWQHCPWCPPPATVISFTEDVVGSDEEKCFISVTPSGGRRLRLPGPSSGDGGGPARELGFGPPRKGRGLSGRCNPP